MSSDLPSTPKPVRTDRSGEYEAPPEALLNTSMSGEAGYVTTNYEIVRSNRTGTVTREELEAQQKVIETLAETSKHLTVETNIITILERIAESVVTSLGVKKANFWDYTPDKKGTYIIAAHGIQDQYVANSRLNPMPLGEGWIGRTMATGQAWATSDAQRDPLLPKSWLPAAKKQDYHGLLCVPLKQGDEVIGGMCLYHQDIHEWQYFEYEVMNIVANQAATALINARSFEQLTTEERKISSIINSLNEGLVLINPNEEVVLINPTAKHLLEIDNVAVLGNVLNDAFVSQHKRLENLQRITHLGLEALSPREIEIQTSRAIVLEVTRVPVQNEDNNTIGQLYVLHDTTEKREIELMKNNFISVASHQIRTPLTGIRWAVDTLRSRETGELNDEQRTILDNVAGVTKHFAELISDLLDVSRMDEGCFTYTFVTADINATTSKVVQNLEPAAAARSVRLTLHTPKEPLPSVCIDTDKIDIALQNLVDNAIKYTHSGEGLVDVRFTVDGEHLSIVVTDNGIGIPEDQQSFVFNKFFRADNAVRIVQNGSGLGLYITKQIIEAHNGSISFTSTENSGSSFSITLPLTTSEWPRSTPTSEETSNE